MTGTFDRKLARLLLEACRFTYAEGAGGTKNKNDGDDSHSYLTTHAGETITGKLESSLTILGDGAGRTSKACVFVFADRNVVSYMGTEVEFDLLHNPQQTFLSFQDWVQDGKARPVPFTLDGSHIGKAAGVILKGKVHHGFLEELRFVQSRIVEHLAASGGIGKPVVVTGHSQGAGETALAIPALTAAGYSVESTYMFAPPRAGNDDFVESVNDLCPSIHRIEFGDDVVPHLPPLAIRAALESALIDHPFLKTAFTAQLNKVHDFGYVALGRLTYGHQDEHKVHISMSQEDEAALFLKRLMWMSKSPKNWGDHHHLAGTTADTSATPPRRGNYTAIVSPEPEGWPSV
ncbi:MAG TPA: lipase family protein [Planctomycetaceae bacterium]|nr:lipase family protein [Planctomycetaceae bacterium]HQZ65346.1 lipase family protein [Planctomycetaceae bacterium]